MTNEKKYLCLSFDDGPNISDPQTMSEMLDIMEKYNVPASFFIIGNKVTPENKSVIKRAIDMGCDIQNHSWTHSNMAGMSAEEVACASFKRLSAAASNFLASQKWPAIFWDF